MRLALVCLLIAVAGCTEPNQPAAPGPATQSSDINTATGGRNEAFWENGVCMTRNKNNQIVRINPSNCPPLE